MLTKKQSELLRFIHERLQEAGVPPSFDEMKEALELRSKSGIHRLIMALEERGFIRRLARLDSEGAEVLAERHPGQSGSRSAPWANARCRRPACSHGADDGADRRRHS